MGIRRWAPVVGWMALIFFLSAQSQFPSPQQRWLDLFLEKAGHTIEFAILAALLTRALAPVRNVRGRAFLVAVAVSWLYALSDEFHQSFVPGRNAGWSDVLFDWIGAVGGAWLWTRHRAAGDKETQSRQV
jgi:VanZ family protein